MRKIYFFFSLILLFLLGSCKRNASENNAAENTGEQETQAQENTRNPEKGSVYDMDMTFVNQFGKRVEWSSLKGKVQVMAMVFTRCEYACPRITEDIKNIEKKLSSSGDKVQYTLVSFDVKKDTVPRLLAYYKEKELNQNWQLLRGNEEDVQIVSALLDVKYKPMSGGIFSHENVITVIDQNGEIVLQREGLDKAPEEVVNKIKSLL